MESEATLWLSGGDKVEWHIYSDRAWVGILGGPSTIWLVFEPGKDRAEVLKTMRSLADALADAAEALEEELGHDG